MKLKKLINNNLINLPILNIVINDIEFNIIKLIDYNHYIYFY